MKQRWLLIALLLVSITGFADEKTRCGHFQGKVIKIEQSYIYGWPEYVGSSVWDAKKFKKGLQMGCDDPFRSLAVIVNWPEMTPNGGLDYKSTTHNIAVILKNSPKSTVLSGVLNNIFLVDGKIKDINQFNNQVKLDAETGLWKLEVRDSINGRILGTHYDAYWSYGKDNNEITRYIRCGHFNNISLNNCTLTIYLKDYKATLSIDFTNNLLPQWSELERQAVAFIRSKTIN